MKEGEILSILIQRKKDEFGGITAIADGLGTTIKTLTKWRDLDTLNKDNLNKILSFFNISEVEFYNIGRSTQHVSVVSYNVTTLNIEAVAGNAIITQVTVLENGKTSSDYIFVSKNGDWVNEDYFKSRFKRLKSEDKITIPNGCTLCSIRHTFFVNLYRATKDIYLVMRVARHKSVNTTMRYLRSLGENINNDNISMIETL